MKQTAKLREHIPLEQGLRLPLLEMNDLLYNILREHIPLEQGLRPSSSLRPRRKNSLREHIPLEQGLRRRR